MKKTKYISYLLIGLISYFSFIGIVHAASLNLSASASTTSTVVGNTITVSFTYSSDSPLGAVVYSMNYDSSKLTLTGGSQQSQALPYQGTQKSDTIKFTFKAIASGSTTVSFKVNEALDFDGNGLGTPSASKTINIQTQAQVQASYSSNNNLSSLTVSSGELSPAFNKNTLDYSVTVENDVTEISVGGSREDNKSSVSGFTNYNLDEGANKIEVRVTAQNGSSKTYNITVTRKELAPINVKSEDGKELSIVRKKEQLTKPNDYFEESELKLDDEVSVPSLTYKVNDMVIELVGLKDGDGNSSLYRYKEGKYYPYTELKNSSLILINITDTKDIPDGYKKVSLKIDEKEYTAYQKDNSNYYLVYGTNLETGKSNVYRYESKEKTLQLYDNEIDKAVAAQEKRVTKRNYVIYGLGIFLILTYVGILISLITGITRNKRRKRELHDMEVLRSELENKLRIREEQLKEKEEKLRLNEENITKELNKKKKSDKIEENISKEKKTRRKKEVS